MEKNCDTLSALDTQVGGNHYKSLGIQPVEYIHANEIGYFEGNVIKYVSRWKSKHGISDLRKAAHYIELLIELEERKIAKETEAQNQRNQETNFNHLIILKDNKS